jgi:UDP-N-acetylglucosamine enolpyruvyl transferase
MAAENQTDISGLEHLDRGYENFEAQLVRIGGRLERVTVTSD